MQNARAKKEVSVTKPNIPAQPRTAATDKLTKANVQRVFAALHEHPIDNSVEGKALSFKLALPGLGSMEEIRAFIGHVAQGIALGIFTGREGSQLLYAAQVALGALRGKAKTPAPATPATPKSSELFAPERKKK
jgi:hypothetical protein